MRFSQIIHKIPDPLIVGTIFICTCIIVIYLISSINSFKLEIRGLKETVEKMRIEQKNNIKMAVMEGYKENINIAVDNYLSTHDIEEQGLSFNK